MKVVTIEREHRNHEVHLKGASVLKWIVVMPDGRRFPVAYQQKKPYTIYKDTKGQFIKLRCDNKTHKHYI